MAKDTGKVNIHGKEYKTVALRVNEFRDDCGCERGIITEIVEATDIIVIMKASIIDRDGFVVGTGYAEERRDSSMINKTSALENCETSAIGRALAACGYAGTEYASANEVENAIHQQNAPLVKVSAKVKEQVLMQSTKCLEQGDDLGLKQVWAEFDADEKVVLWGMFNSQQRAAMKELMK